MAFEFETLSSGEQLEPDDKFPFEYAEGKVFMTQFRFYKRFESKSRHRRRFGKIFSCKHGYSRLWVAQKIYFRIYQTISSQGSLFDFRITLSNGEVYGCSKEMLRKQSEYFLNYFNLPGSDDNDLTIDNIPHNVMVPLLEYVHYGKVNSR